MGIMDRRIRRNRGYDLFAQQRAERREIMPAELSGASQTIGQKQRCDDRQSGQGMYMLVEIKITQRTAAAGLVQDNDRLADNVLLPPASPPALPRCRRPSTPGR